MENRKTMRPFQPFTFQTGMPNFFFPISAFIWNVCVDGDFFSSNIRKGPYQGHDMSVQFMMYLLTWPTVDRAEQQFVLCFSPEYFCIACLFKHDTFSVVVFIFCLYFSGSIIMASVCSKPQPHSTSSPALCDGRSHREQFPISFVHAGVPPLTLYPRQPAVPTALLCVSQNALLSQGKHPTVQ